jgi:hypothetical protein
MKRSGLRFNPEAYKRVQAELHPQCACVDIGCPVHKNRAGCYNDADTILYRVDMEDATGTAFCERCADDAMDSGLFTNIKWSRPSTDDEDEHSSLIDDDGWESDDERARR